MKNLLKLHFLLSAFLLGLTGAYAQSIPDSTMQKINGFRAFYETLGNAYPADSTINVAETEIAGVKSYWFNQSLINQKHLIIYLHGGVYAYGSIKAYRAMLSHLARSFNAPVLYIEYSLSPEHPFPVANNEILKVYQAIQQKYPGYKVAIIGDSAGGGLALSLVRDAQKANLPTPASIALISPWIDLKGKNKSYETKQALDPVLNKAFLYEHAGYYAGTHRKEADPSEIRFKAFPPVLLLVGTDEILNDDAKNFYAYIKPVQPAAQLKEFEGQKHVWLFSDIHSKPSIEAIGDIREFIQWH